VQGAPQNPDQTGPEICRADFTWCMTAISWGHGIGETAARLIEESAKARENGEPYALLPHRTPPQRLSAASAAAPDLRLGTASLLIPKPRCVAQLSMKFHEHERSL